MALTTVRSTGIGSLPAISGANLTSLNASNISSGTLNSARFSGGKVVQLQHTKDTGYHAVNTNSFVNVLEVTITPTSSSNSILLIGSPHIGKNTNDTMVIERCFRVVGGSDVATQVISDISARIVTGKHLQNN